LPAKGRGKSGASLLRGAVNGDGNDMGALLPKKRASMQATMDQFA